MSLKGMKKGICYLCNQRKYLKKNSKSGLCVACWEIANRNHELYIWER
jgi:uncharacterized protein HemX